MSGSDYDPISSSRLLLNIFDLVLAMLHIEGWKIHLGLVKNVLVLPHTTQQIFACSSNLTYI